MSRNKPFRWLIPLALAVLFALPGPLASAAAQTGTPPLAAATIASPVATPAASPVAAPPVDRDVTFKSGADTIYGSLMTPANAAGKLPAVVIISGSGPTDRNGNDPQFPHMDTNLNFARTLAGLGVASLRYDKVSSGKTGLATHAGAKGIDFTLFVDEARDAYRFLAAQPGIDPNRILLLGHSEGGLIALVVATHPASGVKPAGLILASAPGNRYLTLIQDQLAGQFETVVKAGRLTAAQASAYEAKLASVIDEIRTEGKVTTQVGIPAVDSLFNPLNIAFLRQADAYDPQHLAASLPAGFPVLVLHGTKDAQVSAADTTRLMDGFTQAGNSAAQRIEIPNADHTFRIVPGTPNPATDYANPNLIFAPEIESAIAAFLEKHGLA